MVWDLGHVYLWMRYPSVPCTMYDVPPCICWGIHALHRAILNVGGVYDIRSGHPPTAATVNANRAANQSIQSSRDQERYEENPTRCDCAVLLPVFICLCLFSAECFLIFHLRVLYCSVRCGGIIVAPVSSVVSFRGAHRVRIGGRGDWKLLAGWSTGEAGKGWRL